MIPWIFQAEGLDIEIRFGSFRRLEFFSDGKSIGKGRTGMLKGSKVSFESQGRAATVEAWNYGAYGMQVLIELEGKQIVGVPRSYSRQENLDITQT